MILQNVPRYSHRCKITTNIPFPKTARLWLAWFSAASITSTGGKGSPREGQEEFRRRCALNDLGEELVGSYLYQVHLHHELEFHDYDRSCQATMYI
jgi:hypothetical protein